MFKKNLLLCALGCLFASSMIFSQGIQHDKHDQIIPMGRRIEWNPGIPDGIKNISGPVENILDHGADPNGEKDSWKAFVSAMEALPDGGGIVFIPEGKFLLSSSLSISSPDIVFRGMGQNSKIFSASKGNSIEVLTYKRGAWQALKDGAEKGTLRLKVEDGSLFSPGKFVEIEQDNDSLKMYTREFWIQKWAMNSVGQHLEVIDVDGNMITFRSPLNYTYSASLNARIRPLGMITAVGFEDFYIEKLAPYGHTFTFRNTAYCWMQNVESYRTRRSHVNMSNCMGNEIRASYFHRSFDYGGGGSGYGVECGPHVTNCLIENNRFDSLRHAMLIQVGANGNVYGYNYSSNTVQGTGETGLNEGWIPPDISIHGHFPLMNLFEGNDVEEIAIGDWWGPAGPGNTYFRNRIRGEGIFYYDASHEQNVIANISTGIQDVNRRCNGILEHGNVLQEEVSWDPTIAHQQLPNSYYLKEAPKFLEGISWPCFGPDVKTANILPAQYNIRQK